MKQIRYVSALIIALLLLTIPVFAYTPYQNYTYNADKESTIEPQAYIPYGVINSEKLHLTMKEPQDSLSRVIKYLLRIRVIIAYL